MVRITFVGSGDAFAAGGRFNPCFHVKTAPGAVLIDCGATSLVALRKQGIDPSSIATIFISHLHGDHYGGLPALLLEAKLVGKRTRPLAIAGPAGLRARLAAAIEALYPRYSKVDWGFDLQLVELQPRAEMQVAGIGVTAFEVEHFSGAPSLALRLVFGDKILAYSGDTQWTETLVEVARGADLFICECYMFEKELRGHMTYRRIMENADRLEAKRLMLTHMSGDMLAHQDDIDRARAVPAEDGMVVEL
ncbi:MAG: MBL fold metallo-hydrolase [Hyphomicrobiales bacterium]|nr:MBL fold metallo-hydrolase [Hyphomicrobiales bacterium]